MALGAIRQPAAAIATAAKSDHVPAFSWQTGSRA
jgi:hypothetical protein